MTSYCTIHGIEMRRFEKEGREWFSHKTDEGAWCKGEGLGKAVYNGRAVDGQTFTPKQTRENVEEKVDAKVWEAKDKQSMAQTALKSASEVVAALINAGVLQTLDGAQEVKDMANKFYKELQVMKGS